MQKFLLKASLFLNLLLLVYIFYYSDLADKGRGFLKELRSLLAQKNQLQHSLKNLSSDGYSGNSPSSQQGKPMLDFLSDAVWPQESFPGTHARPVEKTIIKPLTDKELEDVFHSLQEKARDLPIHSIH